MENYSDWNELVLFEPQGTVVLAEAQDRRYLMFALSPRRPNDWNNDNVMFKEKCDQVRTAFDSVKDAHDVCPRCVVLWTQKIMADPSYALGVPEQRGGPPCNVFCILDRAEGQPVWHVRGGCPNARNAAGRRAARVLTWSSVSH